MRTFSSVFLQTPRSYLRPLQPADAEPLFRIYSDPEFMRYWSSQPWTSLAQAQSLIEGDLKDLALGEHLRLGIFLTQSNTLVGTCSLFHFNAQCRRAEIGYGIASTHWRRGYMSEAVGALIAYAFGELGLNRLEADIDPRNVALSRVAEHSPEVVA